MLAFVRKKRGLAAAALTASLACGSASPAAALSGFGPNSARRSALHPFDGGGSVVDYYGRAHALNRISRRTVIAGVCASACTMKLGIRNACIEPDAMLLFHQASYNGFRSELGTRVMLYAYPQLIRHWVLQSGALNSSSFVSLSGRQAIAMGIRSC